MKKILLANVLLMCAFTVKAEPMLGINAVMDKCHVVTDDGTFAYQGPAETKLTINDNFVIATCKAEYIVDADNPVNLQDKVEGIPCHVGIPGWAGLEVKGPSYGTGGFTVSATGIINAFCKAPRS